MEKGYLHWKADILTEFDPYETALDRFVNMDKDQFIGKAALMARIANGPTKKLVSLEVECTTAPAHGGASVMQGGKFVGTVSSGDWGHRIGKNLAYAFVDPDLAIPGCKVTIDILGKGFAATVIETCQYDPEYKLLRG